MKSYLLKISKQLGAHTPQRYIKGVLWVFMARLLSMSVSLVTAFYIARTLGPKNFGELSYSISIISLLAFFGAIASSTVICRDLVRKPEAQNKIIGTSWFISLLGIIASLFFVFVITLAVPHDQITMTVIAILCVGQLFASFQVTQNVFFATANTKYISLSQLFIHICVSVMKVIAMINGQGVLVLAAIMLFEQILAAVISITLYVRFTKNNPLNWSWDPTYAKQIALDSIPFVLITMSSVVAGRIDQVFLKHYIDTVAVGIYNVAVQFTEIWQVLPQMFIAVLFPALVNAHVSKTFYKKRVVTMVVLVVTYCLSASLFTSILAPYLIPLIYGEAFVSSIPLLQIYTWSLLGTVIGFLITNVLVTENQRKIQIAVGLIPMFLNIGLNLIWIPSNGAAGAAWATVISYSIAPLIPFCFKAIRQSLTQKRV